MFCNKCGKEIPNESEFCPYCGNKLNEKSSKRDHKTNKNNRESIKEEIESHKLLVSTVIILILFVLIPIALVLINYNKKTKSKIDNDIIGQKSQESITNQDNETVKLYLNILANKKQFNFKIDGTGYKLQNVILSELNTESEIDRIEYCIFDIDNDNYDEMYTQIYYKNIREPIVVIFNEQDDYIYGFEFSYRQVENLKTDGTCLGYGGIESYGIYQMKFDEFTVIRTELASREYDSYIINNKAVTEKEFNDFFNKFENKKNIELTTYDGGL